MKILVHCGLKPVTYFGNKLEVPGWVNYIAMVLSPCEQYTFLEGYSHKPQYRGQYGQHRWGVGDKRLNHVSEIIGHVTDHGWQLTEKEVFIRALQKVD